MRFACFVVLLGLSSASVAKPEAPHAVQQAYRMQLAAQCPAKHLDWVSPADLFDLLEDYSGGLPQKVRHDITRAEARRCAGSPGGASCPNAAVLEVAQRHHLISQIAAQTCSRFSICRDQSDCDAVSSGSDEPVSIAQMTAGARWTGMRAVAPWLAESDWNRALALGSSGSGKWLRVLVSIRRATDGARSEAIDNALSRALAANPTVVLSLARANPVAMRPASLCAGRAIEPTQSRVADFARRAIAALKQVQDPKLAGLREQCLAQLEHAV